MLLLIFLKSLKYFYNVYKSVSMCGIIKMTISKNSKLSSVTSNIIYNTTLLYIHNLYILLPINDILEYILTILADLD